MPYWKPTLAAATPVADTETDTPYSEFFLDTARVTLGGAAAITINSPTKDASNPLFPTSAEATGAWDRDKGFVSVVKNDAGWHMFYTGFDTAATPRTGYAFSTDGVTWTKPNLGLVTYDGGTNNNILRAGVGNHTIYDPDSDKWVSVREEVSLGGDIFLYTQDTPTDAPTLVKTLTTGTGVGEGKSIVRRPSDNRWILYYTSGHATSDRSIYAIISDTTDLTGTWTEYGIILDAPASTNQFYSMHPSVLGQVIYGTVHRYNSTSEQVWTDLYYSLNGTDWVAVDANWVDPGTAGAWDDEMVFPTSVVVEGDEWHFYYSGAPLDHATFPRDSRIGRVTVDRERIGSVGTSGTVTTDYMVVAPGATARVNSSGTVTIEVQDTAGDPLTGFAAADFDDITTDDHDHVPTWNGVAMPGGLIRLVFTLSTATLYAFEVSAATRWTGGLGGGGGFSGLTRASMSRTTTQSIAHNTLTTATFDTEDFDSDGSIVDLANEQLDIQTTGVYVLSATGLWANNTTGVRVVRIRIAASTIFGAVTAQAGNGHSNEFTFSTPPVSLTAGQSIILEVFQTSGISLDLEGDVAPVRLALYRIDG